MRVCEMDNMLVLIKRIELFIERNKKELVPRFFFGKYYRIYLLVKTANKTNALLDLQSMRRACLYILRNLRRKDFYFHAC